VIFIYFGIHCLLGLVAYGSIKAALEEYLTEDGKERKIQYTIPLCVGFLGPLGFFYSILITNGWRSGFKFV